MPARVLNVHQGRLQAGTARLVLALIVAAGSGCARRDAAPEATTAGPAGAAPATAAAAAGAGNSSGTVRSGGGTAASVDIEARAELQKVQVLSERPHDPSAFTQGLVWHDGWLYESTGQYGESKLRRVDPGTGVVLQEVALPVDRWGEGLALVGQNLVQLTWREHVAMVYDRATLERRGEFSYETEGWGLCFDGSRLVLSDGSPSLYFRDPDTFAMVGRVSVLLDGAPLANLNELECVGDRVYANVWLMDTIVRIDLSTGRVEAVVDASGLLSPAERVGTDVLNGIAYDPTADSFLVTGKLWPKLFEVRFVPAGRP